MSQLRTVQVLGGGSAGSSAHVGSLAAGLVERGVHPERCARLAEAGRAQAAGWPTEDDTIAHVLSVYDELAQPAPGRGR
ncbi:hypothetical protein SMICM304S_06355 [Streptomyces microflavus]